MRITTVVYCHPGEVQERITKLETDGYEVSSDVTVLGREVSQAPPVGPSIETVIFVMFFMTKDDGARRHNWLLDR